MRVMLDTNVLITSAVFSSAYILRMLDILSEKYTIVLSTYIVDELKRVTYEKFPHKCEYIIEFLRNLPYELTITPEVIDISKYPSIRDVKDLPVLVSAIDDNIDILLTGDKDFAALDITHPEVLTPQAFMTKYGNNP